VNTPEFSPSLLLQWRFHKSCRRIARLALGLALLALVLSLCACAGKTQDPIYETFLLGFSNPQTVIDRTPLNPNLRYLKVEANGQPALLVLGYVDQHQNAERAVWYSAFKEVIEIKEGRLANTAGLDVNWTQVTWSDAPPLQAALTENNISSKTPARKLRYTRERTVMPGYQVNIRETVVMEPLAQAPSDIPRQLKDLTINNNADLRWVQETVLVSANNKNPSIKPLRAIYAIDRKTNVVVFGKQYLTPDYTLSWLSWPYPATTNATAAAIPASPVTLPSLLPPSATPLGGGAK
jgi:hypothetical protein